MKKALSLVLLITVCVGTVFSQSSQVVSAWNYVKYGQFEEAKTAINQAINDPKTSTWPKTWFYRGSIYLAIYNDSSFKKNNPDALPESIRSFEKSMEVSAGGKNEYKDQLQAGLQECALSSFNEGVTPYNEKNYQLAYNSFKQSADVYEYINKTFQTKTVDTLATLYAAHAATKLKKYGEAEVLYQSLLDKGISQPDIYASMGELYVGMGDTAKAIAIISKGTALYPNDKGLMIQELNVYLFSKRFDEAEVKLKEAIEKDPKFVPLYVQLANIYELKKDTANARKTYEQAIAIEPNSFDAQYRLGAMYYNQAVELNNTMNKLDLNQQKQYDLLKVQRDATFRRSLPYLENAHLQDPKDMDTMIALKELYARLNMTEKLDDIKRQIDAAKG
ncbi:MAG: tetratricopeptide repeat protein [Chitinophagaceae bacterium]|nr:tetratricopeptide repeat protein [Chitinophagaceae bacterium]